MLGRISFFRADAITVPEGYLLGARTTIYKELNLWL